MRRRGVTKKEANIFHQRQLLFQILDALAVWVNTGCWQLASRCHINVANEFGKLLTSDVLELAAQLLVLVDEREELLAPLGLLDLERVELAGEQTVWALVALELANLTQTLTHCELKALLFYRCVVNARSSFCLVRQINMDNKMFAFFITGIKLQKKQQQHRKKRVRERERASW